MTTGPARLATAAGTPTAAVPTPSGRPPHLQVAVQVQSPNVQQSIIGVIAAVGGHGSEVGNTIAATGCVVIAIPPVKVGWVGVVLD